MRQKFGVAAMMFVALAAFGQDGKPKTLEATEVQHLKLEVAQRDAQLSFKEYQQAQANYGKAVDALRALGEQIKKDNHWPDNVSLDLSTLTFTQPAPPAPKPAEKK